MSVYKREWTNKAGKVVSAWYFNFQIENKRMNCRARDPKTKRKAKTRNEALNYEAAWREIVNNKNFGWLTPPTLAVFVEEVFMAYVRANHRYPEKTETILKPILEHFGAVPLDKINPITIEEYKAKRSKSLTRLGQRRAPASVNRELEMLSRMLSAAVDNDMLQANPCRKVRKLRQDNARYRYLLPDEQTRLMVELDKASPYMKPLVLLAIQTGMRRGELLKLEWRHVDFDRNVIIVTQTKSAKDRYVPMSPDARAIFSAMFAGRTDDRVFHVGDFKRTWLASLRRAEIADFRFHDLRHTAATRWASEGAEMLTIAKLLGHSTIQMSARYTHVLDTESRRVVEAAGRIARPQASENV